MIMLAIEKENNCLHCPLESTTVAIIKIVGKWDIANAPINNMICPPWGMAGDI